MESHIVSHEAVISFIWPNLYPLAETMFLTGHCPEEDPSSYFPEVIPASIWPNLYPVAVTTYLTGYYPEEDPSSYFPEYIPPSIWPNLYPVAVTTYLIGCYPEEDPSSYFPEYIPPSIWPDLYPGTQPKLLLGNYLEKDISSYVPKYRTPTLWPSTNSHTSISFYTLGKSNPYDYGVYDVNYGTKISIWPNVYNSEPMQILGNAVDYDPIYNITLTQQQYNSPVSELPDYVVASMGGTLDDILLPTLWSVENNLYRGFDTINKESPWSHTIDLTKTNNNHTADMYDTFEFAYVNYKDYNSNYIGLLNTVLYPKFSVLYERYPDVRTIIISFDEDDIIKIMTNTVYKIWLAKDMSEFQLVRLKRLYKEFYNEDLSDIKSLKKEFIDFWINNLCTTAINHPTIKAYMYPEIPENNKNILVLKYKDFSTIENETYVAISKLSKFIKTRITEDVIDKYKLAVQKQQTFIENFCPIKQL